MALFSKKTRFIFIGLLLLIFGGVFYYFGFAKTKPTQLPALPSTQELETFVEKQFQQTDSPGMVVTLYRGKINQPLLSMPLGFADDQQQRKIQLNDHFRIASISKSFVGYVILKMAQNNQLSLDDTLDKYVPEAPHGDQITLAMLGFNISGVANFAGYPPYQRAYETNPGKIQTEDELLALAQKMEINFTPGSEWEYSNTNTLYLRLVIEKITGLPLAEALKQYVFDPLGLANTGVDSQVGLPHPSPKGYRYGKQDRPFNYGTTWFDVSHWRTSTLLYSNEKDLAVFTHALASGELLNSPSMQTLQNWQATNDRYLRYGYQVWDYFGAMTMIGDVPGFSSFTSYLPEHDVTLVVLANLSNESMGNSPAYNMGISLIDFIYGLH